MKLVYAYVSLSFRFLLSVAGKANLEKADLEPAFKALKDRLMTKNVVSFYLSFWHSIEKKEREGKTLFFSLNF